MQSPLTAEHFLSHPLGTNDDNTKSAFSPLHLLRQLQDVQQ